LQSGDAGARARVADEIMRSARDVGFFYIAGHGVPASLVEALFDVSRRYFAMPLDSKMANNVTLSRAYRGYLPMLARRGNNTRRPNLLESYNMMLDLPPDDPEVLAGVPLRGPNQWPDFMPEMQAICAGYMAEMARLTALMTAAFETAFQAEAGSLQAYFERPLCQLRLLHYPPQKGVIDENLIGSEEHTDSGSFTILLQDLVGGLEVVNNAGEWIGAPPIPGTFVINVGDMLSRWTNGYLVSTRHRVVNRSGRERYSMPYFINPHFDAMIECLPAFRHLNSPLPEPLSAGDWFMQRYKTNWPGYGEKLYD